MAKETIRYYVTSEITEPQRKMLLEKGYHIYGLRDWEGDEYGIEPHDVFVNNIGYGVTDKEIPMPDGFIGSNDFYNTFNVVDIPHDDKDLREIFSQYKNTNYHYHIKGKTTDRYECIRTYDVDKAKEILKVRMKYIKEKDPSARAYRFGTAGSKAFWKVYSSIKNTM